MQRILFAALCLLISTATAATDLGAEEGYFYGLREIEDGLAFGRTNLDNGEIETIKSPLEIVKGAYDGPGAIDTRRNHYSFFAADRHTLVTLDLATGDLLKSTSHSGEFMALQYDSYRDRYFAIRVTVGLPGDPVPRRYVVTINPKDFSSSEVLLQDRDARNVNSCMMVVDALRDEVIYVTWYKDLYVYSLSTGEVLRTLQTAKNMRGASYNWREGLFYSVTFNSPKGAIEPDVEFITVDASDGTFNSFGKFDVDPLFNGLARNCSFGMDFAGGRYAMSAYRKTIIFSLESQQYREYPCLSDDCIDVAGQVYTTVNQTGVSVYEVFNQGNDDELELRSLANGHVVLYSATNLEGQVSLYSLLGQPVFQQKTTGVKQLYFNFSHLSTGNYFLRVESKGKVSVKALVLLP